MTPMSELEQFKAEQERLLARIEQQKAEELEIRRAEFLQNSEIVLSNERKVQADLELAKQRAESNRLIQEQNLVIQELILTVRHMVIFIEEGRFDGKIDALNEGVRRLHESQNNVVRTVESLILVILGKGNVSPEDLLQLAKSGLIRYDGDIRHNSNTYAVVPPMVVSEADFEETIVKLLVECQAVNGNLNELVGDLHPSDIRDLVNQGGALRIRTRQLVKACAAYGAWGELVKALRFYEGESLAVAEVIKFLRHTGKFNGA